MTQYTNGLEAYEGACDMLDKLMDCCSNDIDAEKQQTRPDIPRINGLYARRTALLEERLQLRINDRSAIERIHRAYTAEVRARMGNNPRFS